MNNILHENQKLGEIVSIFPGSSELFNQYKIDYCCGGHDTLKQALEEKAINITEFVITLNKQYEYFIQSKEEYKDWRTVSAIELMTHIEGTHHLYTKKTLIELDYLVNKILKVHFKHHSEELLKVHHLFGLLKIELEEHLVKEEENLFALIEEYESTNEPNILLEIKKFIKETEDEHDAAGDILKELEKVTNDFTAPVDACNTYRLTYTKLQELEKDLFTHIYLENSVLFNKF